MNITTVALRRYEHLYLNSKVYLKHMVSTWLSDTYDVNIIFMNIVLEGDRFLISPKNKESFYLKDKENQIVHSVLFLIDNVDI
jgi:hypothetical protein